MRNETDNYTEQIDKLDISIITFNYNVLIKITIQIKTSWKKGNKERKKKRKRNKELERPYGIDLKHVLSVIKINNLSVIFFFLLQLFTANN